MNSPRKFQLHRICFNESFVVSPILHLSKLENKLFEDSGDGRKDFTKIFHIKFTKQFSRMCRVKIKQSKGHVPNIAIFY